MQQFKDWLFEHYLEWQRDEGVRKNITELAAYLEVPQPTVSRWLNGNTIPNEAEHIHKIARRFGGDIYKVLDLPPPELAFVYRAYQDADQENQKRLHETLQGVINRFLDGVARDYGVKIKEKAPTKRDNSKEDG